MSVECKSTDTIEQLKSRIFANAGLSEDSAYLTTNTSSLSREDLTLKDYNIQQNTQFTLKTRLRGGVIADLKFADVSMGNMRTGDFKAGGGSGKKWNIIYEGANLQGRHPSSSCDASGETVYHHLGFGTFHISKAVLKAKCPVC